MPYLTQRQRGRNNYKWDADEIQAYAFGMENRADHQRRFIIHDEDQAIWQMEKYTLEEIAAKPGVRPEDWPSFTSNDPRAFWNVIRRAATSNTPRFRIKLPNADSGPEIVNFKSGVDERTRHERFAMGLWQEVDYEREAKAQQAFQLDAAFQLSIRGGCAVRCFYDNGNRYPFRAQMWDLRTVVWDIGPDGLCYAHHHYKASYEEINGRYQDSDEIDEISPDEFGEVDCYDIWWLEETRDPPEVWNCLIVNSVPIIKPTQHKDLDHLPIVIVPTFTPTIERSSTTNWQVPGAEWESIYTTNKQLYRWINRVGTLYGIYLRQHAIGPYVSSIKGVTEDQLQKAMRPFSIIAAPQGGDIKPVAPPEMAESAKEFLAQLQAGAQRGSVPYSIFGQTSFQLSGFAINQLQGAISIYASQVTKQLGTLYRHCTDEFIQQYRKRGGKITIKGFDQRKRGFIEEITKSQIREKYFMEVTVDAELPVDKLQEAQIAQSWSAIGVSPYTILDEVLKLDDPSDEAGRMAAWQIFKNQMDQFVQQTEAQQAAQPPPSLLPPEVAGQLAQHQQFQPNPQNLPGRQLNPSNGVPVALPQNSVPFQG